MNKSKPTSPGKRWKLSLPSIKKSSFYRHLLIAKKNLSGRNNLGRITVFHKGGGVKKKYRVVDFKRNKFYTSSKVERIDYDPNRNCYIFILLYNDGERRYILGLKGLKVGDFIISGLKVFPSVGNSMLICNIPIGFRICCVELYPGKGAKIARSAGSYCSLVSRSQLFTLIKLKSGRIRKINNNCMATIGEICNQDFYLRKIGKAGTKRLMGIRPTVRGVAMNPVDHPHGGGEGKTSSKRPPVDKYGNLAKGFKTRKNKRTSKFTIFK